MCDPSGLDTAISGPFMMRSMTWRLLEWSDALKEFSLLMGWVWLALDLLWNELGDGRHLRPCLIYLLGLTYFDEVSHSINLLNF